MGVNGSEGGAVDCSAGLHGPILVGLAPELLVVSDGDGLQDLQCIRPHPTVHFVQYHIRSIERLCCLLETSNRKIHFAEPSLQLRAFAILNSQLLLSAPVLLLSIVLWPAKPRLHLVYEVLDLGFRGPEPLRMRLLVCLTEIVVDERTAGLLGVHGYVHAALEAVDYFPHHHNQSLRPGLVY